MPTLYRRWQGPWHHESLPVLMFSCGIIRAFIRQTLAFSILAMMESRSTNVMLNVSD